MMTAPSTLVMSVTTIIIIINIASKLSSYQQIANIGFSAKCQCKYNVVSDCVFSIWYQDHWQCLVIWSSAVDSAFSFELIKLALS